ncbi:histidine phosphatase family protein [Paenibacillus sp. J2TS4]|uniref:histidine phosphatase family protein n=1 Tax=Paenibacillus sp. J2TS4 TaxID=2807194 RepID=UPI001B2D8FBC|nr:histidine phosphatase family protein [Paenibacillus sp. J2TS4]GIP30989.1 hypothetical protein J2TS4_01990 [Paenibacillus sp. J2TS4]
MRLYIIRHADPDYENGTITPEGHLEAKALAERLEDEGIDEIFCSPLNRAIHTMQYTARRLTIKPAIVPWFKELEDWDVEWPPGNRIAAWNVHGEWLRQTKPYPTNDNWHHMVPYLNRGLEVKLRQLHQESDQFMESLGYRREEGKYRILRSNTRKIAIFCHHGLGVTWLSHLLELPLPLMWTGFWMAPSSVTTILMDERSAQWAVPRCLGFSDISHLYKTGLPISTQGLVANVD